MKKIIIMMVLVALVFSFAAVANANSGASNAFLAFKTGGISDTSKNTIMLDNGDYTFTYNAICGISPTSGNASLYSANPTTNNIWIFESYNEDADTWTSFDTLIYGGTTHDAIDWEDSITKTTTLYGIDGLRIRSDYKFTADSNTSVGIGSASITVVPEPSSILAACSMLAPLGFMFKRKRK